MSPEEDRKRYRLRERLALSPCMSEEKCLEILLQMCSWPGRDVVGDMKHYQETAVLCGKKELAALVGRLVQANEDLAIMKRNAILLILFVKDTKQRSFSRLIAIHILMERFWDEKASEIKEVMVAFFKEISPQIPDLLRY